MKYNPPNLKRQERTFDALSSIGDSNLIAGVWLQSPADDSAYFVGCISRISDVTIAHAIERQYPLIERYAWSLRPKELHPSRGPFIVYYTNDNHDDKDATDDASNDNNNNNGLTQVMEEDVQGAITIDRVCVGFKGAMYNDAECEANGFRVEME